LRIHFHIHITIQVHMLSKLLYPHSLILHINLVCWVKMQLPLPVGNYLGQLYLSSSVYGCWGLHLLYCPMKMIHWHPVQGEVLGTVCTWRWKFAELAQTCTECRNSCNELSDVDLSEWPWSQLICCASYKPYGRNFRDWSCKKL